VIGGRELPKPASYLTAPQRVHFNRIVRELSAANLLDTADRGMLELAAIELDVLAQCNKELADSLTHEVTRGAYNGSEGYVVREISPFLKAREDAVNKLRTLYHELGIGPASRASLANGGTTGKKPHQTLPGVGAKPTPLKVVNGGKDG
jgi:P27 family predicted phage terminase small subunit